MASDRRTAIWEVLTGAGLAAIGAAFLWEGWDLPDGYFEPMGPRPVPMALSWVILLGSLAMVASGAFRLATGRLAPPEDLGYVARPGAAAAMLAITIAYCAALSLALVPYWLATALFLVPAVALLGEFRRDVWVPSVVIALALGIGLHLLFTRVLVTDLP